MKIVDVSLTAIGKPAKELLILGPLDGFPQLDTKLYTMRYSKRTKRGLRRAAARLRRELLADFGKRR